MEVSLNLDGVNLNNKRVLLEVGLLNKSNFKKVRLKDEYTLDVDYLYEKELSQGQLIELSKHFTVMTNPTFVYLYKAT